MRFSHAPSSRPHYHGILSQDGGMFPDQANAVYGLFKMCHDITPWNALSTEL